MPDQLRAPTPEEVSIVGRRLGVTLPQDYVHFLVHYPFPLDSDLAEVVFFPKLSKIVGTNEYYRRDGFYNQPWPKHFLIIGDMGNFDLIFLDTTRSDSAVFMADHDLTFS